MIKREQRPPLPAEVYIRELDSALDEKYNTGVYTTGRKVIERLLAYYVKPKKDSATQTPSLKQLTQSLESKIEFLDNLRLQNEEEIKTLNERNERL